MTILLNVGERLIRDNWAQVKLKNIDEPNEMSPIDLGTGIELPLQLHPGDFHTCAILDNSSIKCWGLNDSGQLGQGNTPSTVGTSHAGGELSIGRQTSLQLT